MSQALARLREGLAAGDAYEAQQVVKTAYYRLRARGQLQDGYDLLQASAAAQFGAAQFTCGLELAKLLIEVGGVRVSVHGFLMSEMRIGCREEGRDAPRATLAPSGY